MSDQHLDEIFFDLVVGGLDPAERARADRHLASCAPCRADLAGVTEAFAAVGDAEPPLSPRAHLRRRILSSAGASRFAAVADKLAALFDLGPAAIETLLGSLELAETWSAGPLPGLLIAHVAAGPARAGAYTGLVRMAPELHFPAHRHLGAESMLVLQGGFRLNDGRLLHTGDALASASGSAHDFVVLPDSECIAAVVQEAGVEFGVGLD